MPEKLTRKIYALDKPARATPGIWTSRDVVKHVNGFFDINMPLHKMVCRRWYRNIAYLAGLQYMDYTTAGSYDLRTPDAPRNRVRAVFNELLPLATTQKAKILDFDMDITCRPMNRSEKDTTNADIARRWLKALWKSEEMQDKVDELASWKISCSVAYILTLWDGRIGTDITPEQQPGMEPPEQAFVGDVSSEVVPPFEIVPDFTVIDFNKQTRFGRMTLHRADYLSKKYDTTVGEQDINFSEMYQFKIMSLAFSERELQGIFKNHAVSKELFELPSEEYPNGLHAVISGKKELLNEDLKYIRPTRNGGRERFLPISVTQMIPIKGMLIGTNGVEQGISPQTIYNRGNSAIMENANLFANLKLIANRGRILDGAMAINPDQKVVELDPEVEGEVDTLKSPEMARYILNFIAMLPQKIQDAFGLHEISMGRLPRRATTGPVVRFMGEQDDTRIASARKDLKKCVRKSFQQTLWITAENYTEERILDLIGDDKNSPLVEHPLKVGSFRAIDVDVEEDAALPRGSAQRADLAMAIVEKKLTRPQIKLLYDIIRARSIEDWEGILSGEDEFDELYAHMETKDMLKGVVREPVTGENHKAHRPIHMKPLSNPKTSDEIRSIILQHVQLHDQKAAEEAQVGITPPGAVGPAEGAIVPAGVIPEGALPAGPGAIPPGTV